MSPVINAVALGLGKTNDTTALQQALDRCAAGGGGEVVIPAGTYVIGSVKLGSHTTLRLSENATLVGSPDPADYPIVPVRFEGETVPGHCALIHAENASQIVIEGLGTIQGDRKIGDLRRPRAPALIELTHCDHVTLNGFKDRYRRMWSIHLLLCHQVNASNLNIRSTLTNGDGIDVDSCTNVSINHCDIDTGDDCISLKSGRGAEAASLQQSTANVIIKDCKLGSNFAGVGIGTEMSGGVHDVQIDHCTFTRGDNAIFLKSRLGRGGVIENIFANNLDTSSKNCIGINLVNKGIVGSHPVAGEDGVPVMRHIHFDNITIHAGTLVDGLNVLSDKPIDDFSLTNVSGSCQQGISLANVTHANLSNIHVTGYTGPLLQTQSVTGDGLDSAVRPGNAGVSQLTESFQHPPDDTRPLVRWWWFGPAVTKPELSREIDSMKAGGFGGFEVQPTYPLAVDGEPAGLVNLKFMSPEFLEDLGFVAQKAKETGMMMDLTLGSGWPYGGAIFPITEAAGRLRIARVSNNGDSVSVPKLSAGETLIAAYVGKDEVPVRDGKVVTNSPEVLFFISSRTGMKVKRPALGAEGYVLDHDSLPVVSKFIDQIGNKEVEACGKNPPYSVFCDSLESSGEDWTENFLSEFQKRRGYDLRPYLPALVSDMGPKTLDIRHDWGQTLTELFNDSFVKPMRSLAEDHKIRFRIQAYGQPSAGLFSYGDADLPEGEGYQWHGYRASRYASSACHLMGVPVSSSEAFTWLHDFPFRATPLDIKAEADLHFLQGINQLVCHGWPYTAAGVADPGWSFYVGGVFDEKNPWYIVMPDVNRYLSRVSYLMRQGKPANDVLLYLSNSDAWAQFKPGHISLSDGVGQCLGKEIVGRILDGGYNLDFFDDQMLDRFGRVNSGNLSFGDLRYKVVVLAGVERMPLSTLRKLEAFARGGGVVIATRRAPAIAPGFAATDADQQEVHDIVKRLFFSPGAPGIFVEDESQIGKALATRLAPDITFSIPSPQIGFVHRHTDYADIYFVANTSNRPVATRATFRIEGETPHVWNPLTGEIKRVDGVNRTAGGSQIDLSLDAYGSTVILWDHEPSNPPNLMPRDVSRVVMDLNTGWEVQFGKKSTPIKAASAGSWTNDPSTEHFSGVATYTQSFPASANVCWLTFGEAKPTEMAQNVHSGPGYMAALDPPVREAAIVYVNNHLVGSVWCPPYQIDISHWIKEGNNTLRIEVANTALNGLAETGFPNYDVKAITRQFGDRFTPPVTVKYKPLPSGLLGDVRLFLTQSH
jgi:hypothetical protein